MQVITNAGILPPINSVFAAGTVGVYTGEVDGWINIWEGETSAILTAIDNWLGQAN